MLNLTYDVDIIPEQEQVVEYLKSPCVFVNARANHRKIQDRISYLNRHVDFVESLFLSKNDFCTVIFSLTMSLPTRSLSI